MTKEQFNEIRAEAIECNDIEFLSGELNIFHVGEGARFSVAGARALRDFLNRALPDGKTVVERFNCTGYPETGPFMDKDDDGEYVRWEDYAALVREVRGRTFVTSEPRGECICPTCGVRHGSSNADGGF